jgi:putative transposase
MVRHFRRQGRKVNRKRIQRMMRLMGIEAIYPKPHTSRPHPEHKIYPYLLRDLTIDRPNQVWATDITYVPMARGFMYLVAIMDWHTRKILAWRISNALESDFCVNALQEALRRYGAPEIFNTDQGAQFTSSAFTETLQDHGVKISMDGRGRCQDNIFIERLWWTIKHHYLYLHSFDGGSDSRQQDNGCFRPGADFILRRANAVAGCFSKQIFSSLVEIITYRRFHALSIRAAKTTDTLKIQINRFDCIP